MKHFFSSASSSSSHSHHKPKRSVVDHGAKLHKCDLCDREFTTGNALGGHKAFHSGNNFHLGKINKNKHVDGIKINHSCELCSKAFSSVNALNGHMKSHSPYGSKKGSKNYDQDQFPPIDLRKYLPPMRYVTKKRTWNYVIDVEADVAEAMLDMSERSPNNLDVNHRVRRRIKLCRNVGGNGKIKDQGGVVKHCIDETIVREKDKINEKNKFVVRLKIPNGLVIQKSEASNDDNEENNNTDEPDEEPTHELGSNVVRDFDLNELPVDDDADETAH